MWSASRILLYAAIEKPQVDGVAVEHDPSTMEELKHTLRRSRDVAFIQKAVANHVGTDEIPTHGRSLTSPNGEQSIVNLDRSWNEWQPCSIVRVETTTIAALMEERNLDSVKLVKDDVQGARPVIEEAQSWIIELHDLNGPGELEGLMTELDYRLRWVDDKHLFATK